MTDPISGRVPPETQKVYQREFKEGVKLFQKSLAEYEHSTNDAQKAAFKKVMDEALTIMNQSARGFLGPKGQNEVSEKLNTDYQAFLAQDTPTTYKKLNSDLDHLKGLS
jgi:hypothetical protein